MEKKRRGRPPGRPVVAKKKEIVKKQDILKVKVHPVKEPAGELRSKDRLVDDKKFQRKESPHPSNPKRRYVSMESMIGQAVLKGDERIGIY